VKFLILFAVFFAIVSGIGASVTKSKEKNQSQLAVSLIAQFDQYTKMSPPQILSPHAIAKSTEQFDAAPIQLIIFSDFQCPACKALSLMMAPIARRYEGKINILYYFYPLDSSCNAEMTMPLHPLACKLSYIAHCSGANFHTVHDQIFEQQESLSAEWTNDLVKKLGVEACINDAATKSKVVELLQQGKQFNVRSTPTMVLNGVKIEGALPLNQFYILMDELVKRHGAK
jgi:protein-disulfide isomerase